MNGDDLLTYGLCGPRLTADHVILKYTKIRVILEIVQALFCWELLQSVHVHTIIDYVAKFIKVPVVADVGVVVSLANVLAVGEVTVVGVVVLSSMHTHRIRYFRQIIVQS